MASLQDELKKLGTEIPGTPYLSRTN